MVRSRGRGFLFALLLAFAPPAAADPLLMLLMSVAREVIESAARRQAEAPRSVPEFPATYPGTTVVPEQLRQMIDESFAYLGESQRREIFDSLHATLLDPKIAGMRAPLIEYFASRAHAVREAQLRLARLSQREKESLASEFRKTVEGMPLEEAAQLVELLRKRLLPVPADLNDMLLAALQQG